MTLFLGDYLDPTNLLPQSVIGGSHLVWRKLWPKDYPDCAGRWVILTRQFPSIFFEQDWGEMQKKKSEKEVEMTSMILPPPFFFFKYTDVT